MIFLGRCPRLRMIAAPLALNTYVKRHSRLASAAADALQIFSQRGSATRPRNRHTPLGACWIASTNGRSTLTSIGGGGGDRTALPASIATAVAAAASVPFSSTAMNV